MPFTTSEAYADFESQPLLVDHKDTHVGGVHVPDWVPNPRLEAESERPRTIVLCFDGTGDQFDNDNSNVIQFLQCLKKNDPKEQLVYYQTGIGTYTSPSFITPVVSKVSMALDGMFAWNLSTHIQEGYAFLMDHYEAGDRISLFGFSRGAYTARALAGMIQRVGLLPAGNKQQIPFAYKMYSRSDSESEADSASFKKTFCADIMIDFLGVWDTVASVGIFNKELPFVRNNTAIRVFRHALALDEHRAKFMPNFYHKDPSNTTETPNATPSEITSTSLTTVYPKKAKTDKTDACETWFAGVHCDVGGGSVVNGTKHCLSRIPLRWMIRECYRMQSAIIFDANMLKEELGMDIDTLYPVVKPRGERKSWAKEQGRFVGVRGLELKPHSKENDRGYAIVTFIKAVGMLLWYPIKFALAIIVWPFEYFWEFIKYRALGHVLQRLSLPIHTLASPFLSLFHSAPKPSTLNFCSHEDVITEEDHELLDALSPEYDQLPIRWYWRLIEYLPLRFVRQSGHRNYHYVDFNRARGREIYGDALYDPTKEAGAQTGKTYGNLLAGKKKGTYAKIGGLKIHRSVLTRLEARDESRGVFYVPRARYEHLKSFKDWYKTSPDPERDWEWVE